jgi:uncharacterized membrane protein YfcA
MKYIYLLLILLFFIQTVQGKNECKLNDCPEDCDDPMWIIQDGLCTHKELFPFHLLDGINTILVSFLSIFASVAGVGGGGTLNPIYILIGKFGTDYSIPLTVVTIAGSSLARLIILFNKKHPHSIKRFLISYSPIMQIVPFDGNVAFIGAILNIISPSWLILVSILFILSIMSIKTIKKAFKLYEEEKNEENQIDVIYLDGICLKIKIDSTITEDVIKDTANHYTGDHSESRITHMGILIGIFSALFGFTIANSFLEKCSIWYWLTYLLQIVIFIIIGCLIARHNIDDYDTKRERNYRFLKGDIKWNSSTAIKVSLFASMTGIISSYLGIGGGMIISPFLLHMGMTPEVVASTNSITTFFSSLSSSSQYMFSDRLIWSYCVYYFIISFISSYIGLKLASKIVKKRSVVVFMLAGIIMISGILLLVIGVTDTIEDVNEGSNMGFNNFCE